MTASPIGAALFGKLPAHGDFVTRGFSHDQRARIDAWLAPSLAQARAELGAAFDDAFDAALPWQCTGDGVAGAIAASEDTLGRRFPILLLVADATAAPRCAALLYAAIGERWSADRLAGEAGVAGDALPVDAVRRWWLDDTTLHGASPLGLLSAICAQGLAQVHAA